MNKFYHSLCGRLGAALFLLITAFIVHSCRKNSVGDGPSTVDVSSAKSWYESTYPVKQNLKLMDVSTAGQTTNGDFSQIIKPDWGNSFSYSRFGSHVIELPLDTIVKLGIAFDKPATGDYDMDKNASKNSFLIIGDAPNYKAYIISIVADSSYLRGDYSKLANLSYRHIDKDFTGSVLYFKPGGGLVNGYRYLNGKIIKTIKAQPAGSGLQVQNTLKTNDTYYECTSSSYYVYTGVSCVQVGTYRTCTYYFEQVTTIECIPHTDTTIDYINNDDSGGGAPPPETTVTQVTQQQQIKQDSLRKKFPCASVLIINSLLNITDYQQLTAPFNTPLKPDLNFDSAALPWNQDDGNGHLITVDGRSDPLGASSTITLNQSLLQNSSQLLIAATVIHETLHAVINYNTVWAGYSVKDGESWMSGLNSWYLIKGLPTNFSNHYEMMDYYFNQAFTTLKQWDYNTLTGVYNHSDQEYRMSLLVGLNEAGDGATTTQVQLLQTEYDALKSRYGLSQTDINTFVDSQRNATTGKLPASNDCN